jgi:hypothetical protein
MDNHDGHRSCIASFCAYLNNATCAFMRSDLAGNSSGYDEKVSAKRRHTSRAPPVCFVSAVARLVAAPRNPLALMALVSAAGAQDSSDSAEPPPPVQPAAPHTGASTVRAAHSNTARQRPRAQQPHKHTPRCSRNPTPQHQVHACLRASPCCNAEALLRPTGAGCHCARVGAPAGREAVGTRALCKMPQRTRREDRFRLPHAAVAPRPPAL